MENTAPHTVHREISKETFNPVEPGGTRRGEVEVKPRVAFLPAFDLLVLMGGVVIADEVNLLAGGCVTANPVKKSNPFLMAVPVHTSSNDLAIGGIHGREQRGGSVSLVIMGHGLATPFLERQSRLRAIQGLDLTLLVAGEDQGMLRRIEIEPHNVLQLFFKVLIIGKLEAFDAMRLQSVGRPHPPDTRGANPDPFGHRGSTPVGGSGRFFVEG